MKLCSLKAVSLLMLLSTVAFNFAIFQVTREDKDASSNVFEEEATPTMQTAHQFAKKFEELYSPSKEEGERDVVASAAWRSSAALKATQAAQIFSADVDDDEELWKQKVGDWQAEYKTGMFGDTPTKKQKFYPDKMNTDQLESTVAELIASVKRIRMRSSKGTGLPDKATVAEFQEVSLRMNEFLDIFGTTQVVLEQPKLRELYFCVQVYFLQLETPPVLAPNPAVTGTNAGKPESNGKPSMLVFDSLSVSLPDGGEVMPFMNPLSIPGLQGDENAVKKGYAPYTSVSQHHCTDEHIDEIIAAKKGAAQWRRSRPPRSHIHKEAATGGSGEKGEEEELTEMLAMDAEELEQLQAKLKKRKEALTDNLQQYIDAEMAQAARAEGVKAEHFVTAAARRLLGKKEEVGRDKVEEVVVGWGGVEEEAAAAAAAEEEEGEGEEGDVRSGRRRLAGAEWDAPEWDPADLEAELQQNIVGWGSCLPLQCSRDVKKCSKHAGEMDNAIADGLRKGAALVLESTGGMAGELLTPTLLQSWYNGIKSFVHGVYADMIEPVYSSMTHFNTMSRKERMRLKKQQQLRGKASDGEASDGEASDGVDSDGKKDDQICCSEVLLQLLVDVTSFLSEVEAVADSSGGVNSGGIPYSIFYGSLLGAARNEQLIPWTSDIDLLVPRYVHAR
jgi:hypothetical protein